jgi:hypothetical protein
MHRGVEPCRRARPDALGMAAGGTFGVLMYLFAQRTRKIAIRMALGARAAHVARLVTTEALGAMAIFAAAGLVLSLAATPVLRAISWGSVRTIRWPIWQPSPRCAPGCAGRRQGWTRRAPDSHCGGTRPAA